VNFYILLEKREKRVEVGRTVAEIYATVRPTSTITQLNRELRTQESDTSKTASSTYTITNKQYHYMTSDRFPVPVRSAVV